jgi:hypothetical protein
MPRHVTRLPDGTSDLGALTLQGDVDVAGGVALQFGDLAAHADAAEVAFERVLHRAEDCRDGVLRDAGDRRCGEVVHGGRVGDCGIAGERSENLSRLVAGTCPAMTVGRTALPRDFRSRCRKAMRAKHADDLVLFTGHGPRV